MLFPAKVSSTPPIRNQLTRQLSRLRPHWPTAPLRASLRPLSPHTGHSAPHTGHHASYRPLCASYRSLSPNYTRPSAAQEMNRHRLPQKTLRHLTTVKILPIIWDWTSVSDEFSALLPRYSLPAFLHHFRIGHSGPHRYPSTLKS